MLRFHVEEKENCKGALLHDFELTLSLIVIGCTSDALAPPRLPQPQCFP